MRTWFLLMVAIVCFPFPGYCQSEEDRTKSAVEAFANSHRLKIGFLRVRPQISVGAGFDSNSRYGEADNEATDGYISVIPSASAGVKFGSRAFVRVVEDVTFLYYFKLEERRDIFGSTLAEFVTGGRQILFRLNGGHARREAPVDEEIDEPVDHTTDDIGASVEYSASNRIDLRHYVSFNSTKYEFDRNVTGEFIPLNDRRTTSLGTTADYSLNQKAQLTGDVFVSRSEAVETNVDSTFWGVLGGINYRKPKTHLHAEVGYGRSQSENDSDSRRASVLFNGRINFLLSRGYGFGLFGSRSLEFSALADDVVRITTEVGANGAAPVGRRVSISGNFSIGINDYGNQPIGGAIIESDTFQNGDVGVNVVIWRGIAFRGGITYLNRNTELPGLEKQRWAYYVSFGVGYTFTFFQGETGSSP